MMSEKFFSRASLVCGASCIVVVCALACALAGCGKDSPDRGAVPAPGVSHMKDPQLKRDLREQVSEKEVLVRAQHTIIEKMEAVAAKYGGDLKKASEDPEMASLIRRARDIETNLSSNRAHTAEMIRTRALKDAAARKGSNRISKKEVKQ